MKCYFCGIDDEELNGYQEEILGSLENKARWERLYRIKAQVLILEHPTNMETTMPASKTPNFKAEPIQPNIPGTFKSESQS
ncbi:MAG: hypothetical protein ACTSQJ_07710, partial [Promethearchaeota archaeon]